jgi:hypothetical protein
MIDCEMAFLNPVNAVACHAQTMIEAGFCHAAAGGAGKTDGRHAHLPRSAESQQEIFRIPARRKTDQAVAWPRLRDDLAQKNMVEADVVADPGQHGDIARQIDGCQRRPSGRDRMLKFDGDMSGIAARPAIAHREETAAFAIGIGDRTRSRNYVLAMRREKGSEDRSMMRGFAGDASGKHGRDRILVAPFAGEKRVESLKPCILDHKISSFQEPFRSN